MVPQPRIDIALGVSPSTVLVRGVLEWACSDESLQQIFDQRCRPRQWDRKLTISAITWLMLAVVSGARRSVFAAFQADQATGSPTVLATAAALNAKYGRIDPRDTTAVVRQSARRMAGLLRSAGVRGPVGWRDHRVIVLDGTDLAGTEPRLKPLRGIKAAGLPQSTSDPNAHFVLFTKAVATDLGNLGGKSSTAYAVNSAGQVVGTSQTTVANPYYFDLNSHALLASGGVMKDLGTLGGNNSVAYAINAQGTAVGASDVVPNAGFRTGNLLQNQHAFISNGSNMVDLNSLISDQLNLTLNSAVAMNSAGQSLAAGQAGTNFRENAYLLTPVDQPTPIAPTLAPGPSTIAILGIVAGATWL